MRAYIYDTESPADQREPHDTGIEKSQEDLARVGVLYWRIEGEDSLDRIDEISKERDYKHRDTIEVSPSSFGSVYEEKLKIFFTEHLHEDEEIRFVLDGSGFFDVRNQDDAWIRIAVDKGDMLVLPAGIYHRFTTDDKDYIKAMRLFKDEPIWAALIRDSSTDQNQYRSGYLKAHNITV